MKKQIFKQIKRCINSANNHTWINVSLPAIESINSKDEFSIIPDPEMNSNTILAVLQSVWSEDYIKKMMLTRFIAVVCDNSIRTQLKTFCEANENATQEDIDKAMQDYVDKGWNVDLKHPSTDRSLQSLAKKQAKSEKFISEMSTEQQLDFIEKLKKENPSLAKLL